MIIILLAHDIESIQNEYKKQLHKHRTQKPGKQQDSREQRSKLSWYMSISVVILMAALYTKNKLNNKHNEYNTFNGNEEQESQYSDQSDTFNVNKEQELEDGYQSDQGNQDDQQEEELNQSQTFTNNQGEYSQLDQSIQYDEANTANQDDTFNGNQEQEPQYDDQSDTSNGHEEQELEEDDQSDTFNGHEEQELEDGYQSDQGNQDDQQEEDLNQLQTFTNNQHEYSQLDQFIQDYEANTANQDDTIFQLSEQYQLMNKHIDQTIQEAKYNFKYPAVIGLILQEIKKIIIHTTTNNINQDTIYYDIFMSPSPTDTQLKIRTLLDYYICNNEAANIVADKDKENINNYICDNWEKIFNIVSDKAINLRAIRHQYITEGKKMVDKAAILNKTNKENIREEFISYYGNMIVSHPLQHQETDQPLKRTITSIIIDQNNYRASLDIYTSNSPSSTPRKIYIDISDIKPEHYSNNENIVRFYAFLMLHIHIWDIVDQIGKQYIIQYNITNEDLIYAKIQSLQYIENNGRELISLFHEHTPQNAQSILQFCMDKLKQIIIKNINELQDAPQQYL